MKSKQLFTKMLLVALCLIGGSGFAWADDYVLYSQDYSNAETYNQYWTTGVYADSYVGSATNSVAGATISQASRAVNESTEYYIKLRSDNKNNRGAYFSIPTIGNQYDYTIEFDMALCAPYYETSNINWLIITGTSGTDLAVLNVPSTNSSTTHSSLNIYDSQTLSSTIATCDHGTRGTVGWYHVTLSVTSANGVKMSVTKEGGSSVLSNYTLSSSKENISKLTIWLNPGYPSDTGPHAAISNFVKKTTYSAMYSYAKSEYDTRVASLDALGQTYWSNNVTAASSVTTSALYDEAIAALPTTYLAAVKAQGAGGDMTEAMPTGNAGWTVNQGNGPASYGSTGATETYLNGPKFSTGNIMSQTITGLPNGLYQVQFYGIVNSANNISTVEGSDLVQAYANNVNLDIDVVKQNSCTPTDYLRTIQAEVTDGTLTYGLKVKDEVTDAGNWAVAKTYKLTFLGDTKYNYTINAVAGETTIKQLSTGSEYPGLDYGVYVPYVILYDSKYYVLDDNNADVDGFYANYVMGTSDATKEVSYTLDESIVYFEEGESNTINTTYGNFSNGACSEYRKAGKYNSTSITETGVYRVDICIGDGHASNSRSFAINTKSGDTYTPIFTVSGTIGNTRGTHTKDLLVSAGTTLYTGYSSNTLGVDYIIIRKLPASVSKSISSAGWATYCSPYALDFSGVAGLTAYIVTGGAGGKLTKSVVTSVPAGTGVLLKGAAGDYTIPVATSSATDVTGNKLTGVTTQTQIDANAGYVLMNGSEGVAFYKNANEFTVGANTAYLPANFDATNPARAFFSFGDDATDIRLIENGELKKENSVYDLQGRRIDGSRMNSGIYIHNGRKVVVK